MTYYCYMLECADGSFYTGWTLDPERREKQHNKGSGAKYTRLHKPVHLVYLEEQPDLSTAMKRERAIKKLTHQKKAQMVNAYKQGLMENQAKEVRVISPGRVNLLGEHVDYNDGLVFPAAIDREVTIHARSHTSASITIHATDLNETVNIPLDSLDKKIDDAGKPLPGWALYPAGVAWVLQKHGLKVVGFEADFTSNVPIGAGLSSSAAVEVGFAVLWEAFGGWKLDRMTLAQFAQEAEVHYAGVNCGLMDQFACANGVVGHALLLDTRSLEWRPVKLPDGLSLVIANSGVKHKLIGSEYNTRHDECCQAVEILKKHFPKIQALRDVSMEQLETVKLELPHNVYKRARHIVSEIQRVLTAVAFLEKSDGVGFGRLMFETHASLRDDYEVSCPELDILVESASHLTGCLGARLTGAGFGGCTVNMVKNEAVDEFITSLKREYLARTGIEAAIFPCQAAAGAHIED
ncbi:MAG: galactokinase [Anaerolineaceae bacterium]